jgi:hypothetical protein
MSQEFEVVLSRGLGIFNTAVLISGSLLFLESSRPGKRKMIRVTALVVVFAIIGFSFGVLTSGLLYFMRSRGHDPGPILNAILLQGFFPTFTPMVDYEGGMAGAYVLLFVLSLANGCWYGLIGLLVQYAVETWRKHSVRGRV